MRRFALTRRRQLSTGLQDEKDGSDWGTLLPAAAAEGSDEVIGHWSPVAVAAAAVPPTSNLLPPSTCGSPARGEKSYGAGALGLSRSTLGGCRLCVGQTTPPGRPQDAKQPRRRELTVYVDSPGRTVPLRRRGPPGRPPCGAEQVAAASTKATEMSVLSVFSALGHCGAGHYLAALAGIRNT